MIKGLRIDPDDSTIASAVVLKLGDVRMVATFNRNDDEGRWWYQLVDIEKRTQDAMGESRWESFGTLVNSETERPSQWLYELGEQAANQFLRERT